MYYIVPLVNTKCVLILSKNSYNPVIVNFGMFYIHVLPNKQNVFQYYLVLQK